MSIPLDQYSILEKKIKAQARMITNESRGEKSLTLAREEAAKVNGYRSWQHFCNEKNRVSKKEDQAVLSVQKNFIFDSKNNEYVYFDFEIFEESNLSGQDFFYAVEKMAHFREYEDDFVTWYLTGQRELNDLHAIHDIINGRRPLRLRDRRRFFAVKIPDCINDWFKAFKFEEVVEQICWSLAYLMFIDRSKVKIVDRQTKDLSKVNSRVMQIYHAYRSKFQEHYEKHPYYHRYDVRMYGAYNDFMKSVMGYGLENLMKVANKANSGFSDKFDFKLKAYGVTDTDWKHYFILRDENSPLLRAESNKEICEQWLSLFNKKNMSTSKRFSPVSKYVVRSKIGNEKVNHWFQYCKENQVPYIVIEKKVKYAKVSWDHIAFENDLALDANAERLLSRFEFIFEKFKHKGATADISTRLVTYKNVFVEDSEKLAEELFDAIYSIVCK